LNFDPLANPKRNLHVKKIDEISIIGTMILCRAEFSTRAIRMSGFVIVYFNNEETDRLVLGDRLIIGRTPDCTLCVRDVQLSRRHCAIERTPGGFVISDLQSRNGTLVNGREITRHALEDGDLIRMGRTRLTYRTGNIELPTHSLATPKMRQRPPTPVECLASTVVAFEFQDSEAPVQPANQTYPRPQPVRPAAYDDDDVQRMVEEIASSSWDSILAENSRPVVMETLPIPMVRPQAGMARKRRRDVDLSLQAHDEARPVRITFDEDPQPRSPRPSPEAILDDSIAALELSGYLGADPITPYPHRENEYLPDLAQALAEIESFSQTLPLPAAKFAPTPVTRKHAKRHLWLAAAMVWLAAAVVILDALGQ